MAKLYNLARMTTATTGTGAITLGAAVPGYLTFAQAGVANGDVVSYAIKDGNNSEIGTGFYTLTGTTLTRSVTKSTNSNAAINLSGTAEVFITPRAEEFIPSGTLMLFQQTSAPTGWTKQTSHNDKALRVVSGNASSGGSSAFSTVFGKTATDNFTLSTNEIPSHNHTQIGGLVAAAGSGTYGLDGGPVNRGGTGPVGNGGAHSHTIDMRVQYVDLIIASKD